MKKHSRQQYTIYSPVRSFTAFVVIGIALIGFSAVYYYVTEHDMSSSLFGDEYVSRPISPFDAHPVSISEESDYAVISGSYPQFPKASKEFNDAIKNTVLKGAVEHKAISEENWKARMETDGGVLPPTHDEKYTYVSDWNVTTHTEEYASVVVRHGGYSGGAHGSYAISTFTYEYIRGKVVTLDDMFLAHPNYLKKLSEYARVTLRQSLAEKMEGSESDVAMDMLNAGTEPTKENFSAFTVAPDLSHVTIYFGLYQVAPYVFGEQQIDVDLPTNDNIEPAWLE